MIIDNKLKKKIIKIKKSDNDNFLVIIAYRNNKKYNEKGKTNERQKVKIRKKKRKLHSFFIIINNRNVKKYNDSSKRKKRDRK